MSKKPIASYEDYLDEKSKTTYEQDLDKEAINILNLIQRSHESGILTVENGILNIIKVLVGKNLISLKDVQRILGD